MSADSYRRGLHKPRKILCLSASRRNLADLFAFLRPTVRILRAVHGDQQWPEDILQKRPSYLGRLEVPSFKRLWSPTPSTPLRQAPCLGADTVLIWAAGRENNRENTVFLPQACAVFNACGFRRYGEKSTCAGSGPSVSIVYVRASGEGHGFVAHPYR